MNAVKRLYTQTDEWLKGLSRVRYAGILGLSAGFGFLVVGLLLSNEARVVEALTMALVMFTLECVFGLHQTPDD